MDDPGAGDGGKAHQNYVGSNSALSAGQPSRAAVSAIRAAMAARTTVDQKRQFSRCNRGFLPLKSGNQISSVKFEVRKQKTLPSRDTRRWRWITPHPTAHRRHAD